MFVKYLSYETGHFNIESDIIWQLIEILFKKDMESENKLLLLINNNEDIKSNIEMPPQRDIRDAQPTISVNYRVIRNTEKNNFKSNQNYSNSFDDNDDWNSNDNDW